MSKMLLYTLECIVIVMVWIAVLLLLLIYIRWAILHLGIFILELFLTRENMKINEEKKHFKEAFHCHWIKACTVLFTIFKCKGPVGIKTFFQNFNTIYSKLK